MKGRRNGKIQVKGFKLSAIKKETDCFYSYGIQIINQNQSLSQKKELKKNNKIGVKYRSQN